MDFPPIHFSREIKVLKQTYDLLFMEIKQLCLTRQWIEDFLLKNPCLINTPSQIGETGDARMEAGVKGDCLGKNVFREMLNILAL